MKKLYKIRYLNIVLLAILTFCILLEWILRILYSIKVAGSRKVSPTENQTE